KMVEVNNCLKQLDNKDIADYERNQLMRRLRQLIAQSWHTDEIRKHRPSPVDEAKWGFAVVENSLWEGVPNTILVINYLILFYSIKPLTFITDPSGLVA
ncbi:MAG: phosphoenolpyruvate carboxylase, partial [Enterobacter sp.]|nr:phosphoenolpyruvate carboxylase [Enterobacter sp.]